MDSDISDEEINIIDIEDKEFQKRKMDIDEDIQNNQQFSNKPQKFRCQYCGVQGYTSVDKYNSLMSYLLILLTLIIFGLSRLGPIPILIVYFSTKTYRHKCSCCTKTIGYDSKIISIIPFKNQILTLKIGELGLITKKSTILNIIFIILIMLSVHFQFGQIYKDLLLATPDEEILIPSNDSWKQFLNKCGYNKDKVKCQNQALDRYYQNWEGYIVRVKDESQKGYFQSYYHGIILDIQMDPQEKQNQIDLKLTLDINKTQQYYDIIEQLESGQLIQFSGIFKGIGDFDRPRHFHGKQIKILNKHKDIKPKLDKKSRYNQEKDIKQSN